MASRRPAGATRTETTTRRSRMLEKSPSEDLDRQVRRAAVDYAKRAMGLRQNLEDALTMIDDLAQKVHAYHCPTLIEDASRWQECPHPYCRSVKLRAMICLPEDPADWTPAMQGRKR